MSISVDLADLPAAVARRPFGYLLTTGDDHRPHAVALVPDVVDGALRFAAGDRTCHNAAARPHVSVVFPPTADDELSLVVDGDASVDTSDDRRSEVTVTPTWAVRHRAAP